MNGNPATPHPPGAAGRWRLWVFVGAMALALGLGATLGSRSFFGDGGRAPLRFSAGLLGEPGVAFDSIQWQGEVVVLNAWASWCLPCRTELPLLSQVTSVPGVRLVGLNYLDEANDALQWLGFYGNPFHVNLADPDGLLTDTLVIRGVPQTWVIGAGGDIQWIHEGALSAEDVDSELMPLVRRLVDSDNVHINAR